MMRVRVLRLPRWLDWAIVAGYSGVIFYFSNQESVPLPGIPGIDKVAHLAEYGAYAFCVARAAFPLVRSRSRAGRWAVVVAWCLVYAVSDEIHQAFVPGRSSDTFDVVADVAGTLLAAGISELTRVIARYDLTGVP